MSKVAPPSTNRVLHRAEHIGTQNILVAARDAEANKVVYSGSSTYYGSQEPPLREGMLPQCLNPYALSKYVGERYCELFTRLYGLPTLSLRYFNVYGPRQPHVGAYALVLGIFLDQRRKGEALTIHGTGAQRRDFIHVRDVVEANLAAYRGSAVGTVMNVGSGKNYSVKELADLISPNQVFEPRRRGDALITLADIRKIRSLIGWEPRVSFADGLRELVELNKAGRI